ncbi:hypothetical protein CDAR_518881 [Caerostris darwini]|uniref:Uncharacterized protein n=1 Tax=Caerostris darwini TaxID=1538125 RepID=A0AAV4PQS8_9ARAC|nr:hypothetical protein CDAR_518881 [Caerostris darwini]
MLLKSLEVGEKEKIKIPLKNDSGQEMTERPVYCEYRKQRINAFAREYHTEFQVYIHHSKAFMLSVASKINWTCKEIFKASVQPVDRKQHWHKPSWKK